MDRAIVLDLYREGVDAIDQHATSLTSAQWGQPACGTWSATDLAGHLVCVIGWYHAWLDRAQAGDSSPPFSLGELPARNAAALAALDAGDGHQRVQRFVDEARRYELRLDGTWDLPYGFPAGTVTAGLHAGVAATEWHLHAWDLSDGVHRPSDPRELFGAAGAAVTAARGGLVGRASAAVVPFLSRRKPWEQLLKRSGRRPTP
jgi:uncharacterized protein (TIGR03083 family)